MSIYVHTHFFGSSNPCLCLQVHGGGDARLVQHHPSLQEESFCNDCHRVGAGLHRLLSSAVRLQHDRSGQRRSDSIVPKLWMIQNWAQSKWTLSYCDIQGQKLVLKCDLKVHFADLACKS